MPKGAKQGKLEHLSGFASSNESSGILFSKISNSLQKTSLYRSLERSHGDLRVVCSDI
jgi:hypothetical protein